MNIETNKKEKTNSYPRLNRLLGTQALQVIERTSRPVRSLCADSQQPRGTTDCPGTEVPAGSGSDSQRRKVFRTERSIERPAHQSVRRHRRYLSDCRSRPHRHGVDSHGRLCRTKTNHQRHPRQESDCVGQ